MGNAFLYVCNIRKKNRKIGSSAGIWAKISRPRQRPLKFVPSLIRPDILTKTSQQD